VHLANYKPTSSNAWLGLVINSSYSSINLYEPRPSIVPLMESQGLRDILPTKHDLPFAQTLSRGGPNASRSMKGITKFGLPTLPLKDGNGVRPSSSLPSLSRSSKHGPNPQQRRTNTPRLRKPLFRAPKKPAAPRSRKNAASHRDADPITSVEELLRGSQQVPERRHSSH
jgi:hypothetical protein